MVVGEEVKGDRSEENEGSSVGKLEEADSRTDARTGEQEGIRGGIRDKIEEITEEIIEEIMEDDDTIRDRWSHLLWFVQTWLEQKLGSVSKRIVASATWKRGCKNAREFFVFARWKTERSVQSRKSFETGRGATIATAEFCVL